MHLKQSGGPPDRPNDGDASAPLETNGDVISPAIRIHALVSEMSHCGKAKARPLLYPKGGGLVNSKARRPTRWRPEPPSQRLLYRLAPASTTPRGSHTAVQPNHFGGGLGTCGRARVVHARLNQSALHQTCRLRNVVREDREQATVMFVASGSGWKAGSWRGVRVRKAAVSFGMVRRFTKVLLMLTL